MVHDDPQAGSPRLPAAMMLGTGADTDRQMIEG
jgi:hypothetical protein